MDADEHIRKFPSRVSHFVKKFALCKYLPRCPTGPECTYAHSKAEQTAWNTELRQIRKRLLPGNTVPVPPKIPKIALRGTDAKERVSSTVTTQGTSASTSTSCNFVETEVFKELFCAISELDSEDNNIQIFGPKGTGKTFALKQLTELLDDTHYIDLAACSGTVDCGNSKFLLIDNAQMFTKDIVCTSIRDQKVIAAFSPDTKVTFASNCLTKRCGDGREQPFNWRPFTYDEVKCFVEKLGFTIADRTEFEQKKISERKLKVIFCKTNGNPRFLKKYFSHQNLSYMLYSLDRQYRKMLQAEGLGGPRAINEAFVAVLKSGSCNLGDIPAVIGSAFCTNAQGIGKWKLANSYYGFKAIESLGGAAFQIGEKWQRLETITQLMLSTDVTVFGNGTQLYLNGADKTIQQSRIGAKENIDDNIVTLLVLASNHNVIDNILYDRRGAQSKVYFVQTSSTAYSRKKKGKEYLEDPVKENSTVISNGKSMKEYYTDFLRLCETFYIYATTDLSSSTKREDVYFLDLLGFCPDISSTYIVSESDSDSDDEKGS